MEMLTIEFFSPDISCRPANRKVSLYVHLVRQLWLVNVHSNKTTKKSSCSGENFLRATITTDCHVVYDLLHVLCDLAVAAAF